MTTLQGRIQQAYNSLFDNINNDSDEDDSVQALIIPLLRDVIPIIDKLAEGVQQQLFIVWQRCMEAGMEDILTLVLAQSIIGERASWEDICSGKNTLIIHSIIKCSSAVFIRMYLHVLQKAIWVGKRCRSSDASHETALNDSLEIELNICNLLITLVEQSQRHDIRRLLLTQIHQMFLEDSRLILKLFMNGYPISLIPWIIEYAPSTHILIDPLFDQITSIDHIDIFKFTLAAHLAYKFPIPKTMELSRIILQKFTLYGGQSSQSAASCLKIGCILLEAFPTLMEQLAPMIVLWSSLFTSRCKEFSLASQQATFTISRITESINKPIYKRSPLKLEL